MNSKRGFTDKAHHPGQVVISDRGLPIGLSKVQPSYEYSYVTSSMRIGLLQ